MLRKKDQKRVSKEISAAASKWREIGLVLKIPQSSLDKVYKSRSSTTAEQKLSRIIKEWFQESPSSGVSWQTLVDALRSRAVNEEEVARELEVKYCPGIGTSVSTSASTSSGSGSSGSSGSAAAGKMKAEEQFGNGLYLLSCLFHNKLEGV